MDMEREEEDEEEERKRNEDNLNKMLFGSNHNSDHAR